MAKLTERFCLNLTDSFSGYIELFSDFLKGSRPSILQTKAKRQHFLLPLGQCSEYLFQLFLKQRKSCSICRYRYIIIFNKIAQMGIFLFSDWCCLLYTSDAADD